MMKAKPWTARQMARSLPDIDTMSLSKPNRRHFTPAARAAAIEERRRRWKATPPRDTLEVFVVRRSTANLVFGWEIRRFGAVVIDKSVPDYSSMQEARSAGEAALGGMAGA